MIDEFTSILVKVWPKRNGSTTRNNADSKRFKRRNATVRLSLRPRPPQNANETIRRRHGIIIDTITTVPVIVETIEIIVMIEIDIGTEIVTTTNIDRIQVDRDADLQIFFFVFSSVSFCSDR